MKKMDIILCDNQAVKRLEDGTVFSVGDTIERYTPQGHNYGKAVILEISDCPELGLKILCEGETPLFGKSKDRLIDFYIHNGELIGTGLAANQFQFIKKIEADAL